MKRFIFSLSILFSLSGCASLVVPDVADSVTLEKDQGILATNIVTNISGLTVTIIDKTNIMVASAIFKPNAGENFRVITLPAGEYSWRGIYMGGKYSEFRDKMDFTIKPQEVNYIGDLLIDVDLFSSTYRMGVRDGSDEAKKYVEKTYPALSKTYRFNKTLTIDKREKKSQ